MGFRFYLALIAVCAWMSNGGGQSLASVLDGPQDFLSSLGNTQACPYKPPIVCTGKTKFRTIDGSCNHEKTPYTGRSKTPYIRIYPSLYNDKKPNAPRNVTFFNKPLPGPRSMTLTYFSMAKAAAAPESTKFTNVLAVFTRFIEHDLYKTQLVDVTGDCCKDDKKTAGLCSNIELSKTDAYFKTYSRTCLPKASVAQTRQTIACKEGKVAQQINLNTHYLDLSNIYGSTDAISTKLRDTAGGLLKVTKIKDSVILQTEIFKKCNTASTTQTCFMAGDSRVNNNPLLMAMYTIWVRFHNDVAKEVKGIFPTYTSDQIFQLARKIVVSVYQHIVYTEYLPTLDPLIKLTATPSTMKEGVSPQIANAFSIGFTALADTMVQKLFHVDKTTTEDLKKSWYKPDSIWKPAGIKGIAEGMLTDKAGKIDRFMAKAIYDEYLEKKDGDGTDKMALNFEQSRENGMTTYFVMTAKLQNKYTMKTYADLTTLEADAAKLLQKTDVYAHIYDIEFLAGLLAEKIPATQGIGPLMKYLLVDQFTRLRDGDKFFFNHEGVFKTKTLTEIKKMSMAKVMCKYAKMENYVADVFKSSAAPKPLLCSALKDMINICEWAVVKWSAWKSSDCKGNIRVETRNCLFEASSTCKCVGDPLRVSFCPGSPHTLLSREFVKKVAQKYSLYFDDQGRPRPGVDQTPEDVANNILKKVMPK